DLTRRVRHEAHDAQGGDTLAAAGFADDPQRLPPVDVHADPVDGRDHALFRTKMGLEVSNFQQPLRHANHLIRVNPGRPWRNKWNNDVNRLFDLTVAFPAEKTWVRRARRPRPAGSP